MKYIKPAAKISNVTLERICQFNANNGTVYGGTSTPSKATSGVEEEYDDDGFGW